MELGVLWGGIHSAIIAPLCGLCLKHSYHQCIDTPPKVYVMIVMILTHACTDL